MNQQTKEILGAAAALVIGTALLIAALFGFGVIGNRYKETIERDTQSNGTPYFMSWEGPVMSSTVPLTWDGTKMVAEEVKPTSDMTVKPQR